MSNSPLYQDPSVKYPVHDLELPFQDYIAQCKTLIRNTRVDLTEAADPEWIVDANSPFELKPQSANQEKPRYGALLIHGLLDSPFVMRDIGRELQEQGLLVRALLLPGHGTVPGALLNTRYEDWLQAMHYGIHNLSKDVDHLFIVGFSTGATLGLYHALQHAPNSVVGLILLAPAIKIYSSLDFLSNAHKVVSWAFEGAKWLHKAKEDDYVKYQSMPFNAAYQVYLLTKEIRKMHSSKPLSYPLLVCLSEEDKTVSSQASIAYFQNHTREDSELIVYTNHPQRFQDPRLIPREATYPKWHIRDVSHVCIPIAPDNLHYGLHGDYPRASHADVKLPDGKVVIYGTYNNAEYIVMNKLFNWGLVKEKHDKLTFNPDFDFLKQTITRFTHKIISSSEVHRIPT